MAAGVTLEERVSKDRVMKDKATGRERRVAGGSVSYVVRWREGGAQKNRSFRVRGDAEVFQAKTLLRLKRARSVEDSVPAPAPVVKKDRTLREYYVEVFAPGHDWSVNTRWLNDYTIRAASGIAGSDWVPNIVDVPMGQVTRGDVAVWSMALRGTGMSDSTRRQHLSRLGGMFAWAVVDREIPGNPVDKGLFPKRSKRGTGGDAIDCDELPGSTEIRALMDAMPARLRIFVVLTGILGLRSGEARGLRVKDVSQVPAQVWVRGQLRRDRGSGGPETWVAPKTSTSVRKIPLASAPAVLAMLVEHIEKFTDGRSDSYVVCRSDGRPVDHNLIARTFRRARGEAAVSTGSDVLRELTIHQLRHWAALEELRHGANINDVRDLLGHSDSAVTSKIYLGHSVEGSSARIGSGLSASLAMVRGAAASV